LEQAIFLVIKKGFKKKMFTIILAFKNKGKNKKTALARKTQCI